MKKPVAFVAALSFVLSGCGESVTERARLPVVFNNGDCLHASVDACELIEAADRFALGEITNIAAVTDPIAIRDTDGNTRLGSSDECQAAIGPALDITLRLANDELLTFTIGYEQMSHWYPRPYLENDQLQWWDGNLANKLTEGQHIGAPLFEKSNRQSNTFCAFRRRADPATQRGVL